MSNKEKEPTEEEQEAAEKAEALAEMKAEFKEQFESVALMGKALLEVAEEMGIANLGAKGLKSSVETLQANGFTREEAVTLIAHQGPLFQATK